MEWTNLNAKPWFRLAIDFSSKSRKSPNFVSEKAGHVQFWLGQAKIDKILQKIRKNLY